MKKFLLILVLCVFPMVAMEESGGESSSSYDGDDESVSCDGRSERWTIGPGANDGPKKGIGWRTLMSERGIRFSEARAGRLARGERVKAADERRAREKSSHRCCLPFFRAKK